MSHSFNKIWIHAIWATKERHPLIILSAEKKVYDLMYNEFIEAGCPVRIINGMPIMFIPCFCLTQIKQWQK